MRVTRSCSDDFNKVLGGYVDVFVPNGGDLGRNISDDEDVIENIVPDQIPAAINLMKTEFKKEIEFLENQYGAENVKVDFGILQTFA